MKQTTALFFTLFLFSGFLSPAQGSFNQYNSEGKKQGYWRVFFDQWTRVVKDSSEACFYGYVYYDNGKKIIYPDNTSWDKKNFTYTGPALKKGQLIPVQGTFCWKIGNSVITDIYENGYIKLEESKKNSRKNKSECVYKYVLYFDQHYKGQEGSVRCETFLYGDKTTSPDITYYYKIGKKWKSRKVTDQ